jgi:ATP-dependent RNA helicase DeaD
MTLSFEGLGLEPRLLATLTERGYETPTPIQAALIPVLLEGRDAIGKAPTGTGKTAAFALPAIQRLQEGVSHVQTLVLAPTRELAIQVADTMYEYGKAMGVRVLPVFGGQPYGRQISRLRSGVHVVVGTPGRLLDLCEKGALDLSQVSSVVLDEADEMLSMGFVEDIETLLDQTPKERQTILMSATMPSRIRSLAKKYLRDAESCSVDADREAPTVRQRAYLVNRRDKVAALSRLFETEEMTSVLIFAKTRLGTEDLAAALVERSIPAEALHGNMGQDARTRIVRKFRDGKLRVLVGTDVAARGLDIDDISHVVNFELPPDPEVYVHRIGRTGRAGRGGDAITLFAHNETGKLRRVERFTRQKMERPPLPTVQELEARRSAKVVEQVNVWVRRGRCNAERALVEKMIEDGGDPLEIAAAAMRLARTTEYAAPVESISEVGERRGARARDSAGPRNGPSRNGTSRDGRGLAPRGAGPRREHSKAPRSKAQGFERRSGMIKLALSAGKASGIQVNNVVSTIARHGGIPADAIGRIWIDDSRTVVDVHESEVPRLLGKSGELRFGSARLDVDLV